MAKNTHTGGENAVWEVHDDYIATRRPRGGLVFLGRALSVDGDEVKRGANARLMAAAPEMLRALRGVAVDLARGDARLTEDTLKNIASALASATGARRAEPPDEEPSEGSLEQLKGAILHELRSSGPMGLSRSEIHERLGGRWEAVDRASLELLEEGRVRWHDSATPLLCLTACQRALDDAEVRSAVADKERAACWDALASSRVAPMAELAPTLADAIITHVNAANQERAQRQTFARGLDEARVTISKAIAEMHEHFGRELPCGHKVADLISAPNTVTKCGACILEQRARREAAAAEDPAFVREAAAHPTMKGLAGGGIRGSG